MSPSTLKSRAPTAQASSITPSFEESAIATAWRPERQPLRQTLFQAYSRPLRQAWWPLKSLDLLLVLNVSRSGKRYSIDIPRGTISGWRVLCVNRSGKLYHVVDLGNSKVVSCTVAA